MRLLETDNKSKELHKTTMEGNMQAFLNKNDLVAHG